MESGRWARDRGSGRGPKKAGLFPEHSLSALHGWTHSSSQRSLRVDVMIIPTLQMRKVSLKGFINLPKVKELGNGGAGI